MLETGMSGLISGEGKRDTPSGGSPRSSSTLRRGAFSRLTLQTRDLHAKDADYRVNWRDFGGSRLDLWGRRYRDGVSMEES